VKNYSVMSTRRVVSDRLVRVSVLAVSLVFACSALAQNTISTFAGGSKPGTTATTVDLPGPTSAIRDASSNTYVAAPYSTYVFELSGNTVTTLAGVGWEQYSGDGNQATKAGLALPTSLAIDSTGNIYIADPGNSRIRKVTPKGEITTAVGNGDKCEPPTATCGDGASATGPNVALNLPNAIAVDAAGNLYIADSADHRIRVVNMTSGTITIAGISIAAGDIQTIAGDGNICGNPTTACGDGGPATSAYLNFPEGVAIDNAGNIYIADTRDNRIREIVSGSSDITAFAGNGEPCATSTSSCGDAGPVLAASFSLPMGLFTDSSNNLYIADSADQKVRFINVSGTPAISTVAGDGTQGSAGDSGSATAAELNLPGSVFLDSQSNLLISDTGNQRVRIVTSGTITTLVGGGTGGDGGTAANATFANPYTVAEDAAGDVYVADTANNRVREISAKTGLVSTVAGTGAAGWSGDGGSATGATLNAPSAIAIDSKGNLWIADTGNVVIREVNTAGVITTVAGTPGVTCVAAPPPACGDGGPATRASFSMPLSIAVDAAGNLFVSDYTAQRIREINGSTQIITTVAGVGQVGGVKGNGGLATKAHFNHPQGIVVASSGNSDVVYVADTQNNVVRSFVPGGEISAYALSGVAHLQGDGGPVLSAGQWDPLELAIDPSGNVYIGGGNDNVVQRVDSVTMTIGTVAGLLPKGIGGYSGDGGPATSAKLSNMGMLVDANSNLYIADAGNNRIRLVHLTAAGTATPASLSFPATPLHQNSATQTVTLESSGGVDLNLNTISFGGKDPNDFSETDNCNSPVNLGVDETCTVTITFTPLSYSLRSATLIFTDNALGGNQTVTLSGYGPYFTPSLSPSSLTVSAGSSGSSTVTVTPSGDFNGVINLNCSNLPSGASCQFNPTSVDLAGNNVPQTSSLTFNTSSSTASGTYTVQVNGVFTQGGGELQYTANLQVTIQ
jgi:NHL repeat